MNYYKRTIYRKMTYGSERLIVAVEAVDAEAAYERMQRIYGETHNPFGNWRIGWNWKEETRMPYIKEVTQEGFEDMRLNPSISIIRPLSAAAE